MKILCVCDQGNNRSAQFAYFIKYRGHDVLTAGLKTNSKPTLIMLFDWADKIVTTEKIQHIPDKYYDKTVLYDVGADIYPRPFNEKLYNLTRKLLKENPIE